MDYSNFIEHVKSFEGLRLKAYKCPSGVLTIGYGHTHGVVSGMLLTSYLADLFLEYDVQLCVEQLYTLHPSLLLGSGLYFALTDFVFNVGFTKYKNSTLRKVVDSIKDYSHLTENEILSLSVQFSLWTKSKGRVLRGLEKRRNFEISLLSE